MKYDLIVYGATGFTGRLVAEYIKNNAPSSLNWAIAGRNRAKLQQLGLENVPMVVCDSGNEASIGDMVKSTRVLINMVGPYLLYGEPVVRQCALNGVDYVDITGEVHWVRRMLDKYGDVAAQNKARIVSFCGFDSVPSDLGTYMMASEFKEKFGFSPQVVKMSLVGSRGGFSGGTLASGIAAGEHLSLQEQRELLNPFYLNSASGASKQQAPKQQFPYFDPDLGKWQAPFFMEMVNSRVVRRSVELNQDLYPSDFLYLETLSQSTWLAAKIVTLVTAFGTWFIKTRLGAWVVKKFGPKSGEGPNEELRKNGFFKMAYVACGDGKMLRGESIGVGDPGYNETAKMVSECAFCFALDREKLPCTKAGRVGFLTPSLAFGDVLLDRLRTQHMIWKVKE